MDRNQITEKIKNLPPNLIPEIIDYIDFLEAKYGQTPDQKKTLTFSWKGALAATEENMSSVELQHKALEWR